MFIVHPTGIFEKRLFLDNTADSVIEGKRIDWCERVLSSTTHSTQDVPCGGMRETQSYIPLFHSQLPKTFEQYFFGTGKTSLELDKL